MMIGLEIHVQLPTESKLFCACPTSAEEPNTAICPTCLGFPGSRPSLNRRALEIGLTIARFLDCEIPEVTWFARKTYFYPDLPRNFQITQYDSPIGERGTFTVRGHAIRITRVHLEDDPGRTRRVGEGSLIDYNRSGIPLVEIVTEPDIASPAEARAFVSDMLLELGGLIGIEAGETSVRADCNISMGRERVEVKNVHGLRNIENALKYEAVRQTKLLRAKKRVKRETRRFDEERRVTLPARSKELEEDYGYIGEPDLGVFHVRGMAEDIELPETPLKLAERLVESYDAPSKVANRLVRTSMGLARMFENVASSTDVSTAVTWVGGPIASLWSSLETRDVDDGLMDIISRVHSGDINDVEARMAIEALAEGREHGVEETVDSDLERIVEGFLAANPSVLEDCRGNPKASNRIIGHLMRETRGSYPSSQVVAVVETVIRRMMRE